MAEGLAVIEVDTMVEVVEEDTARLIPALDEVVGDTIISEEVTTTGILIETTTRAREVHRQVMNSFLD